MSKSTSSAPLLASQVNGGLAWFHRWTGVLLCLLFIVWFASGAVLCFVPFPALPDAERLAGAQPVAVQTVIVAPAAAIRAAGGGDQLRLVSASGRTVYLVQQAKRPIMAVDAVTGRRLEPIDRTQAMKAATAFGKHAAKSVSGPFDYDQWVVHQNFDPWRPFYRVSLSDDAGTDLYVSARSGEVVQRTRASERAWNWVGAVSHWLYFTALRKSFSAWDQTVWWVSLFGLTTTVVGVWLGSYRTWKRMRGRRPDWSPFRGWLRWHHGVGLGVAVFVLTWILSGWLSMDHGRLFSRGAPGPAPEARYEGAELVKALGDTGVGALAPLQDKRRITFSVVGSRPIAAGEGGVGAPTVLLLDNPASQPLPAVPDALIRKAAAGSWALAPTGASPADGGDALYRLADGLPDRAERLFLRTPAHSSLYIDPVTGRVLVVMDSSRKAYAWIYFALHTFNFPFLISHPILRRALELIPLAAGLLFSVTGLIIAVRRLRMTAA